MRLEIVLHDRAPWRRHLLPFALTRPVGAFRIGVLTLQEKWQYVWKAPVCFYTEPYLQDKFTLPSPHATSYLVIRANICPTTDLLGALSALKNGRVLLDKNNEWMAYQVEKWDPTLRMEDLDPCYYDHELKQIQFLEDIYLQNAEQIVFDVQLLRRHTISETLHASNLLIGDDLFVGKNVTAYACTLNTSEGPIYIADDVVLEQGSHLKGPIALGKGSRVKMGTRLYPNVSLGPYATVGGEVNNTVMWEKSAKGHDGYLGCAVIGEGCNLGAGTSNSNLQNNWKAVSIYDYRLGDWRQTGRHKVGLFMGDFSMCGINSSFTTGTVVGVGVQVFMSGIIPRFVLDFSWITDDKNEVYIWNKFEEMLRVRGSRRGEEGQEADLRILRKVYFLKQEEKFKYNKKTDNNRTMRRNIVAGNWKMNMDYEKGLSLFSEIVNMVRDEVIGDQEIVVCSPAIHLHSIAKLAGPVGNVAIGAQNIHQAESGAYTGEISAAQVKSTGATYVILGHSERRAYFGESDALLAQKVDAALSVGLKPIFCVGETKDEREGGQVFDVIKTQLEKGVVHLSAEEFGRVVIAYEPVWAIGTGLTASPEQAQEVHAFIRKTIADHYGQTNAEETTLLYGGSCNPANAQDLFSQKDIDGGLIGGASLKSRDFLEIVKVFNTK